MRFFVPTAKDRQHGEALYQEIRWNLSRAFGAVSDKRIFRIKFRNGGKALTIAVGDSFRHLGGEPVLAIVEGGDSYFICTTHHGALTGEAFRVHRITVIDVEEFTEIA